MANPVTLIVAAIFLLIILIVSIRYRKIFILKYLKIFKGKYSYEYLARYKHYFIRSPYQYCFREEFIQHLRIILNKDKVYPTHHSEKDILFEDMPYSTGIKPFMRQRSRPDCVNTFKYADPGFVIKALGYQEEKFGEKVTAVYYFMNDIFFMGEYIFKHSSSKLREKILEDYMSMAPGIQDQFYIHNSRERIIHFHDNGFAINIKYISREDPVVMENLQNYFNGISNWKIVISDYQEMASLI